MEFSRQEYWSGLSCLPPGDLPKQGIEPRSPALQADDLQSELPGKPQKKGFKVPFESCLRLDLRSAQDKEKTL